LSFYFNLGNPRIVYDARMNSVDLTIVIPTFNRPSKVSRLLLNLEKHSDILKDLNLEIIISDNHSKPPVELPKTGFMKEVCKIVSPPTHLGTAEENLLFAMGCVNGKYTWILGDDDEPIVSGLNELVRLINVGEYEFILFNSLGFDPSSSQWQVNRLIIDQVVEKIDLKDFIKRAGFWSLTAGFSTLVFRSDQLNLIFMKELHEKNLKIYSHVTSFLYSFHKSNCAAVAFPLVKYSSNSFDEESPMETAKNLHWVNYGRRNHNFYRNPWTVSFLRQIEILNDLGIFSNLDLFNTFDQGHLGNRFMIFDSILGFLIDQLIYQCDFPNEIRVTPQETAFVCDFLKGANDEIDEVLATIESRLHTLMPREELEMYRKQLFSPSLQMNRRLVLQFAEGKVFTTPYGYFWTPFQVDINKNFRSHSTPNFGIYASTLESLQHLVLDWKRKNFMTLDLQSLQELNINGLNSIIIKLDKLSRLIPRRLRKFLR